MFKDMLQGILTEDEKMVVLLMGDAVSAHLQLVGALLSTDVEDLLLGHTEHRLQ